MKRSGWSFRTLVRYTLFQIPSLTILIMILLLVRSYVDLPGWFVWGLVIVWMVKDAVLFPFVWRAYDRNRERLLHETVGEKGVVERGLAPSGYIRIRGELWKAEVVGEGPPVKQGDVVRVEGIRGLVLLVRPEKMSDA